MALIDRLLAARAARRPVAVVTRLRDGAQALVDGANVTGELDLAGATLEAVQGRLPAGESGPLAGDDGLFARVYGVPPRLLVVGAVHIAQALATMAMLSGFEVIVIDPRQAFASPQRFPGVTLAHEPPDEALARLGLDAGTAVVTLAHDPKLDDPALIAALASTAFYIGALGSRRSHAKRLERLAAVGLGSAACRIHAPVGLELGGRSPAEIAVAVLAQIIQVRRRGTPT